VPSSIGITVTFGSTEMRGARTVRTEMRSEMGAMVANGKNWSQARTSGDEKMEFENEDGREF
jgi:hypothetical protein